MLKTNDMVVIGLGSNLGDSLDVVQTAMALLEQFALPGTFARSSIWRTSPVDCPPGVGDFVNAVAGFAPQSELEPLELLGRLKSIEAEFGRDQVRVRNAPRELDLDLLLFGSKRLQLPELTLPHPRAVQRLFVLQPLVEIAPDLVWPGLDQSVAALLEAIDTDEVVERVEVAPLQDAERR